MKAFDIFYLGAYKRTVWNDRDLAVEWILSTVEKGGGRYAYEDYEIVDRSDNA